MFNWLFRPIHHHLAQMEKRLMAQQEDIKAAMDVMRTDMEKQTTVVGGMSVFIAGIQKQLVDLANASKDDETAKGLMALAAQAESNTKALSDAMAANVNGAPPVVVEPKPEPEPQPAPAEPLSPFPSTNPQ